jgi:predicted nucleotidyltransferase
MVKNISLKFKILKLLIENKTESYTIREISRNLKIDYKNTYESIKQLEDSININKRGNANYISFKPVLTSEVFNVETERKRNILSKIKLIYKDLKSFENPLFISIIFGSYAKNKETKNSDVDICIIHDNEEEAKKILRILSIHNKLEIHLFNYIEFINMIKLKEFNVGHEIKNSGIILSNIESYYEVIKYG